MFDPSAPVLDINKAYVIGESQRGLLLTNTIGLIPVLPALNFGDITETVLCRGRAFDELGGFLNKVHSAQAHVGDFVLMAGDLRFELNTRLASLFQVAQWHGYCSVIIMACANGFAVTSLQLLSESFEYEQYRPTPRANQYQLCWIDRDNQRHAFTDILEVK